MCLRRPGPWAAVNAPGGGFIRVSRQPLYDPAAAMGVSVP
jgi:hypothetical protein